MGLLKVLKLVSVQTTFACLCLFVSPTSFAMSPPEGGSGHVGGGGDAVEIRASEIRDELFYWVRNGGSDQLDLPPRLSHAEYKRKMLAVLKPGVVDFEFIRNDIVVGTAQKTCRNYVELDRLKKHIACNVIRFTDISITSRIGQLLLLHHEFASLVGIERNAGSLSDYSISNQLMRFVSDASSPRIETYAMNVHPMSKRCTVSLDGYLDEFVRTEITSELFFKGFTVVDQSEINLAAFSFWYDLRLDSNVLTRYEIQVNFRDIVSGRFYSKAQAASTCDSRIITSAVANEIKRNPQRFETSELAKWLSTLSTGPSFGPRYFHDDLSFPSCAEILLKL